MQRKTVQKDKIKSHQVLKITRDTTCGAEEFTDKETCGNNGKYLMIVVQDWDKTKLNPFILNPSTKVVRIKKINFFGISSHHEFLSFFTVTIQTWITTDIVNGIFH